jgi:nickel/cobalt transporter (NicO) family protein
MSSASPALLAAAAGVGFGHAILPDHWAPLALVGRTRRYPLGRVARLSGLAGTAHVLVSIVLGAVIILVGLRFRSSEQGVQDAIIGCLLILTGLGYAVAEFTGQGHHHDGHSHPHGEGRGHDHADVADSDHASTHGPEGHAGTRRPEHGHAQEGAQPASGQLGILAGVVVPFGAAASPDLTILPVFLAASTAGVVTALGALLIFAVVTIATIVGLTLLACFGGYQMRAGWLERWGGALTALLLVMIGILVWVGAI